jgi:hypothetical protein
MNNYKSYFIRHTGDCSVSQGFRDQLWQQQRIAVHYEDIKSVNPADYGGDNAKRALKVLNEIGASGGYVCATMHGHSGCLVGIVEPGTKVKLQIGSKPPGESGQSILKTLQLTQAREISPHKANRLLIGQPQQGTITSWNIVGDRVRQFILQGDIQISQLNHLLPFEQEVMCSEFLRTDEAVRSELPRLIHLSAPVGRTRKAVDVAGVTTEGVLILAQVTHSEEDSADVADKLSELREVGGKSGAHLILFCRTKGGARMTKGVFLFPIDTVFNAMAKRLAWCAAIGIKASK